MKIQCSQWVGSLNPLVGWSHVGGVTWVASRKRRHAWHREEQLLGALWAAESSTTAVASISRIAVAVVDLSVHAVVYLTGC